MPKGTNVHGLYSKLKDKYGKASAARIAQSVTGKSLKSGAVLSHMTGKKKRSKK